MDAIGQDCMLEIASFLEIPDTLNLLQINSVLYELLAKSDLFWKLIYLHMMKKRLNTSKRKNCKNRIEQLISRHIDQSEKVYKRACVNEGELVFLKILKKEIDSERYRNQGETLNKLLDTNIIYYVSIDMKAISLREKWGSIQKGIRPAIAAYNILGKKYPISVRLSEKITYRFLNDFHTLEQTAVYYHSYSSQVRNQCLDLKKILYEKLNEIGEELIEIDDVFALSIVEVAHKFKQTEIFKKALRKIVEFDLSSYTITKFKTLQEREKIFQTLLVETPFDNEDLDHFLTLFARCFESKTKAIETLSNDLDSCSLNDIPSEKLQVLIDNGFVFTSKSLQA